MKCKSSKLFTLIELLVILSIIAIMSSLLVTVLGTAMLKIEESKCARKLSHLGFSTFTYLNDHHNNFWKYSKSLAIFWNENITEEYTGDKYGLGQDNKWGSGGIPIPDSAYFCQSNSMVDLSDISAGNINAPTNYTFNEYLLDQSTNKWVGHQKNGFANIAKVTAPDQVSMFTEGFYQDGKRRNLYRYGYSSLEFSTPHNQSLSANTVYADGHVETKEGCIENENMGRAGADPSTW